MSLQSKSNEPISNLIIYYNGRESFFQKLSNIFEKLGILWFSWICNIQRTISSDDQRFKNIFSQICSDFSTSHLKLCSTKNRIIPEIYIHDQNLIWNFICLKIRWLLLPSVVRIFNHFCQNKQYPLYKHLWAK